MKKLFLGALALMLVMGNAKAINVTNLEPEDYIMVLAEDSNAPLMLSTDIIKQSTLLSNLVEQMRSKKELKESAKHKLGIKYQGLKTVKDLLKENNKKARAKLETMRIDELTDIVHTFNFLGYSGGAFIDAILFLKVRVDGLQKKVNRMWNHWNKNNEIPEYQQRIALHKIEQEQEQEHHDDYDN